MSFLYEKLDALREYGNMVTLPNYVAQNLNPNFELRPYQKEAFENFVTHFESKKRPNPFQVLFHMATGSGKTLIMAGLMLYLYKKGYRNFLFFVNLSNIVEKTKENFLNSISTKYLFNENIVLDGERVQIRQVENFQYSDENAINIRFTTTQGLHSDMWTIKENKISLDDFKEQKIVLISDEAHHLNVDTKGKLNKTDKKNYHSWEDTVKTIFELNKDNVLLEFTATCDLKNANICAAYKDKIVFSYPLINFRKDKYSKEIVTLRSGADLMERALMAVLLSQYRLKLFQEKRLFIRPIILFKAAKVADSNNFKTSFEEEIKNLTGARLTALFNSEQNEIIQNAFNYFKERNISMNTLASEIKDDFSEEHCVSVNTEDDATEKQILLNSLEDANNPYRAVFEVKKLDEGWDVLNLFDIVRLYETRQSGGNNISQTTIAEAQLIGRGARYCPFKLKDDEPKFQRKFDEDAASPLRVLETLYYHCQNDSRYVSELKTALKEIGLQNDDVVQREYVLKESFKKDALYKEGKIFLNKREEKNRKDVNGLSESLRDSIYNYEENASSGWDIVLEDENNYGETSVDMHTKQFTVGEIAKKNYALVNKALMKYPVFNLDVLQGYFPNLKSTREFITADNYLNKIKINIKCKDAAPSNETIYNAVFYTLQKIAASVSSIEKSYYGTKEFYEHNIRDVFNNKTVNYALPKGEGIGISQNASEVRPEWKIDLSKEDWFAYTDNFGTTEEKAFVAYFKDKVEELKKKYIKVYLVRNERAFPIYSFEDGERFEPDYALFLQKNADNDYEQVQIFIEPKGDHLIETDKWKEDLLLRLKDEAKPKSPSVNNKEILTREDNKKIITFVDNDKYKIWGFHFFNQNERVKDFNDDFDKLSNC